MIEFKISILLKSMEKSLAGFSVTRISPPFLGAQRCPELSYLDHIFSSATVEREIDFFTFLFLVNRNLNIDICYRKRFKLQHTGKNTFY